MAVGQHVIDAVQQQHRFVVAVSTPRKHLGEPARGLVHIGGQAGRIEVAVAEQPRRHRAAVGCHPAVHGADAIDLVTIPAPVDEAGDAEAGEELRKLRRVSKGVGDVPDP